MCISSLLCLLHPHPSQYTSLSYKHEFF
jgi:hypothetical protein